MSPEVTLFHLCLSSCDGGLEFCVAQYAELLQELKTTSVVVCLQGSFIAHKCHEKNLRTIEISANRFLPHSLMLLWILLWKRAHHIVTHRSSETKTAAFYKLLIPHVQLVSIAHSFLNYRKRDLLHRWIYSKVDRLVAFTRRQRDNLTAFLPVNAERITVIPHFIDSERFRPGDRGEFRHVLGIGDDEIVIGSVGRFDPQKGQIELIEAAADVMKTTPFHLVLVGNDTLFEGGTKERCRVRARELGIAERTHFVDRTEEIAKADRSFDIFVMPSYQETYGLVLVEAMASGCLCVATDAGGPPEILENGLGVLAAPRSVPALAESLREALRRLPEWDFLRSQARAKVQRENSRPQVRECYQRLFNLPDSSAPSHFPISSCMTFRDKRSDRV